MNAHVARSQTASVASCSYKPSDRLPARRTQHQLSNAKFMDSSHLNYYLKPRQHTALAARAAPGDSKAAALEELRALQVELNVLQLEATGAKEESSSSSESSSDSEGEMEAKRLKAQKKAEKKSAKKALKASAAAPTRATNEALAVEASFTEAPRLGGIGGRVVGAFAVLDDAPTISGAEALAVLPTLLPTGDRPQRLTVQICQGKACVRKGGAEMLTTMTAMLEPVEGLEVAPCSCLGNCRKGPAMRVTETAALEI